MQHERMTVLAVERIMKRVEKGAEERMRRLSEVREKMNSGGESISRYLVDLEKKVHTDNMSLYMSQCTYTYV